MLTGRAAPDRRYRSKGPEVIAELKDYATAILETDFGLPPDVAHQAASAIAEALQRSWGGSQVYFPKGAYVSLGTNADQRNRDLYREFDGHNRDELCRKYQISTPYFYQIIRRMRSEAADPLGTSGEPTTTPNDR